MKNQAIDLDAVRDLILFAENSEAVYRGNTYKKNVPGAVISGAGLYAMRESVIKHIIKGDYSDENAVKGFRRVFDFAAKVYARCFCSNGFAFNTATRKSAAVEYVNTRREELHGDAVVAMRDSLLYKAGLFDESGEWFATADDETTDNEIRKAARAYHRISDALLKRAAEVQEACGNHIFFRCVLQAVQRKIEAWMFTAVNARRSSGNVAGADMAAAIIRAAQNLSNRAA